MPQDYKGDYVQIFFQRIDGGPGGTNARVPKEKYVEYCKKEMSKGWKVVSIQHLKNPWSDWDAGMQLYGMYYCPNKP